jgi:hypothetical protein
MDSANKQLDMYHRTVTLSEFRRLRGFGNLNATVRVMMVAQSTLMKLMIDPSSDRSTLTGVASRVATHHLRWGRTDGARSRKGRR